MDNKTPNVRTNAQFCFPLSNLNKAKRTLDRMEADEQIIIVPLYGTRQRDSVYFPEPTTFRLFIWSRIHIFLSPYSNVTLTSLCPELCQHSV